MVRLFLPEYDYYSKSFTTENVSACTYIHTHARACKVLYDRIIHFTCMKLKMRLKNRRKKEIDRIDGLYNEQTKVNHEPKLKLSASAYSDFFH